MGVTGFVTIVTLEEAVVKGVPEREGESIPGDVSPTARAVGVVSSCRSEAVRVGGSEGVVKEELDARAQEAT